MNKLSLDKRTAAISALVEGCSIRSVERMTGIHRDTIMRLIVPGRRYLSAIHGRGDARARMPSPPNGRDLVLRRKEAAPHETYR